MNIEKHIVRLLFSHDCVIIPGFGGFIGRYAPARLDSERQVLIPPSKGIAFNAELQKNDGMLASYIASTEKINYSDAFNRLQSFAGRVTRQLNQRQKVFIEGLGILYADRQGLIQFNPDRSRNFLYDSFGLTPMKLHPVARRETGKPEPLRVLTNRQQAARLMPIAALFVLMVMIPMMIPRLGAVFTSLNPISETMHVQAPEASLLPAPATGRYTLYEPEGPSEPDTSGGFEKAMGADHEFLEEEAEEAEADGQSTVPEEEGNAGNAVLSPGTAGKAAVAPENEVAPIRSRTGSYHIVVGCFSVSENATRMVRQLREQGFESRNIGHNKAGLSMVSASSYPTLQGAEQAIATIRDRVIPTAWIYRKPF